MDFPLALALEDANTKLVERGGRTTRETTYTKSKLFTERTLFPRVAPERVDTVPDALQVSLNFGGKVDPDYMARLTGKPVEAVKGELVSSGQAFENPATGQWENRAKYLSGNVKKKLAEATNAAADNPLYRKNVEELSRVQPPPIAVENIGFKLGSVWIPPATIEGFLKDVLGVEARVNFTPQTGDWTVSPIAGHWTELNKTTWGGKDWRGDQLVEASLNLKQAKVTKVTLAADGKEVEGFDPQGSLLVQEIQSKLQQEFKKWALSSPEVARDLEQIYNDRYNGTVAPKFDPSTWAQYPGASADITLREHQKAVVTRMLQNSTLLAHAVGTGKTYAMVTAAMEMRRLGLARKPMIVVQNATLEQFARSFKRLYPTARILAPNAKMRDSVNRNKTMSRIATGDWDAVIIPQSFVNMLPDDPVREGNYIRDRIQELQDAKIEAARESGKKSPKASDLQKAINRLETRLESLADRKQDNVLTFEQLGVDALFVDEAHAYKKLEFSTKMDNIKGLDTGASQRGLSMFFKARWVQEHNQGRNVIFATGTPVSNTIAEAWNMMRYVRPDVLKDFGIENFDDFASTFGDTVTQLEMTPGGTWKPVTRFARYTNGPELISAWRTVADVVTPEEVNLPGLPSLKGGRPQTITIPLDPRLREYVQYLRARLEKFAAMSGREKREHSSEPLEVFGLAKKASLDMRMIDPSLPDQPGSKLNRAADEVTRIYKDSTPVKGAQMIFSDAFQDNPENPRFNLYAEMKKKLIERGIPEDQIAIITSDIKDAKREALFNKVNAGDLRVVLGSTERMGVGVNAQEHLIALHHLDAPPRPMDIEQRNGRIVRQGNTNPEVEVLSYGVENTLDAAMFQKLATKQKFINQILRGDLQGRGFEDAANEQSLTFEEQMAAFSGDKRAMEKVGLDNQVRQLEALRSGHFEQVRKARDTITQLTERTIPYQQKQVAETTRAAQNIASSFGKAKEYELEVGDKNVSGKEVSPALDRILKAGAAETLKQARDRNIFGSASVPLGRIRLNGQEIELTGHAQADAKGVLSPDRVNVAWKFVDGGQGGNATTGAGFLTSLGAALERVAQMPDFARRALANEERNLRELTGFIQQPFEREAELTDARTKLSRLRAELEAEGKQKPPEAGGEEQHAMASARAPMTRVKASAIAKDLIEGGINSPGTSNLTAEAHGVSIEDVRLVRRILLKGGKESMLSYADAIENGWEDSALGIEESHSMATGAAAAASPRLGGSPKPVTTATLDAPANELLKEWQSLKSTVAPQTLGQPARFAANLLRELNAKMANEMARADVALKGFRRTFDRTPVPKKWQYDPTLPLPRNYAFIDAYEGGNAATLGPKEAKLAAEFRKQNDEWIDRVHKLGTGALQTLVENYFPHIWDNPAKAKQVLASLLGKRPLQGPASFLKQRTHDLFREGLAAGLKPVHDNPVDLWLLKKREVERFILGHSFVKEMREAGLMKFNYVFSKPPEGWSTVNDRAFTVYGPPTVTIKEAFDAGMREKTLEVLEKLGIPHERVVKLAGKGAKGKFEALWGQETNAVGGGNERIKTRFGGPDFVIWHELGHALDSRYRDLKPTLTATPLMELELEQLANLRGGTGPGASGFQSMPEKMAVVLQAYMHAPDLMQRTAPTVKAAFEGFLKAHPELDVLKEIQPTLRLGEAEAEMPVGGLVKLGNWYMPDAAARVVDNFLSPGLNNHLWYRSLKETSNLLNGVQLGLSAFHLGFTSLDASVSSLSLAIKQAVEGRLGMAARQLGETALNLGSLVSLPNIVRGARLRAEVLKPGTHPEMAELVKALEQSGGRVGQDAFWQTEFTRRMTRAWHEGGLQYATLPLRAPLALWEQTMRPILEYIVPRQKLGVFAKMAQYELLKLGPDADAATTREALRKAWDSVDNRMGQVVYDNLFYNRTVKDVALLSFRAYGWQLGKYREGLGALWDTGQAGRAVFKGERPEFTHRMAYIMALPVMVGTIGAVINYLMTGEQPKEARDYFMPRTGELDKHGNAVRLHLPSYVKDVIAYAKHPVTSFGHSLNPLLSGLFELLGNKDFYNTEIRHPDDPLHQQASDVAEFAARQFIPFSVSGAQRLAEDEAPTWKRVAPYFGVTPVPARITLSPAQELAAEITAAALPVGARTRQQSDRSKLLAEIVRDFKTGKTAAARSALAGGISAGVLNENSMDVMMTRLQYTPLQFQVQHMNRDSAIRVWRLANEQERDQLRGIVQAKMIH